MQYRFSHSVYKVKCLADRRHMEKGTTEGFLSICTITFILEHFTFFMFSCTRSDKCFQIVEKEIRKPKKAK